jgi:O-antigen/teichoic acid export membrane protein
VPGSRLVVERLTGDVSELAATARRMARDGTLYVVAGTLTAAIGAYLFQMVGGRSLGVEAFDPVTALLTVHLLVFSVLLLPVEQFEIRRLTLGRSGGGPAVIAVVASATLGATVFIFFTRGHFFAGEAGYAAIGAAGVATNALLAVARGRLAGARRFRAYGLVSGIVALARVALAVMFLAVVHSGLSVGWALAVAPLLTLAWRPFRVTPGPAPREEESGGRFLVGFVVASAASQVLLIAAPIGVRLLDDTPGLMSVVFVTFQLFRVPVVITQNLLARVLPPFTRLAAEGRRAELRAWTLRFAVAAAVAAPVAAVGGAVVGPFAVRVLFGAGFEPGAVTSAYAAAGVVVATASLLAGQVLVAEGATARLAIAWFAGFAVAILALLPAIGTADVRVARAFVVGEVAALIGIALAGSGRIRASR